MMAATVERSLEKEGKKLTRISLCLDLPKLDESLFQNEVLSLSASYLPPRDFWACFKKILYYIVL